MGFRFQFTWALFTEPYGIFLLCILAATFFYAVACALALGALIARPPNSSNLPKKVAFLFIALTLILNLEVARSLELAIHAGLFSLRFAATNAIAALLMWLIVIFLTQKPNARI